MSTRALVWCSAGATLVLLFVGGLVHPTGSSLACPDWPTCYGSFFPPMEGGIFYEHGHRLLATGVGLLTLLLAGVCWRRGERAPARWLALGAVALLVLQGVLGGITVLYKLPTVVSTSHLMTSMAFFLVVILLGFWLEEPGDSSPGWGRAWALAMVAGVYLQVLLGALLRHTGSGGACADLPFCGGVLWPSWGPGKLHMLHRIVGVVVLLGSLGAMVPIVAAAKASGRLWVVRLAQITPVLVLVQVLLGASVVATRLGTASSAFHTTVAATLLGSYWVAALGLGPYGAPSSRRVP